MPYGHAIAIVMSDLTKIDPSNFETKRTVFRGQQRLEAWLIEQYKIERQKKMILEDLKSEMMFRHRDHAYTAIPSPSVSFPAVDFSPDHNVKATFAQSIAQSANSMTKSDLTDFSSSENAGKIQCWNPKVVRREWLRTVYVPALREIGITEDRLMAAMKLNNCPYLISGDYIHEKFDSSPPLAEIYRGNEAFEEIPRTADEVRRVYIKKGIVQSFKKHTEYIEDDFGRKTRRYAYVEKDWNVFQLIVESDGIGLPGKEVNSKLHGNAFLIGEFVAKNWGVASGEGGNLNLPELAFLNQEGGSTTQRAHPISSTAKHLHGNEGYRFGKQDGVKIKIDLAKISVGASMGGGSPQALLNLYSWDAQRGEEKTIGLAKLSKGGIVFTAEVQKEHTDNSTSKNRELMLLKFPKNAIVEILCHSEDYIQNAKDLLTKHGLHEKVKVLFEEHAFRSSEELY